VQDAEKKKGSPGHPLSAFTGILWGEKKSERKKEEKKKKKEKGSSPSISIFCACQGKKKKMTIERADNLERKKKGRRSRIQFRDANSGISLLNKKEKNGRVETRVSRKGEGEWNWFIQKSQGSERKEGGKRKGESNCGVSFAT